MPKDRAQSARPFLAGLNHRTSSLGLRDQLFVEEDDQPAVLMRLRQAGLDEAILLATCDRVEVVGAHPDPDKAASSAIDVLAAHAGIEPQRIREQANMLSDGAAVSHLFHIASSLESLVVGEPQVLGQIKASHRLARGLGMRAGVLEHILQAAYGAAKRVRTDTGIGEGPVSIAAVATMLVKDLHGDLAGVSALLVGAGDMGEMVAEDMKDAGLANLAAIHPRPRRARRTAQVLGCNHADFEDLGNMLHKFDVVIAALGGGGRIIDKPLMQAALKLRRRRPVFIIDTAVPGDVDPAVHDLEDAYVYGFNDLERIAMDGLAGRETEAEAARGIVVREVEAFLAGRRERDAGPLVGGLRTAFEAERDRALAEAGGDAKKATRLLINRLLHGPSTRLRQAAATADMDLDAAERLLDHLFQPGAPDDGFKDGDENT
ncbi:MAG: glutamyl-tRNA reductase [Rhodospirillaceae bacterium]